MTFDAELRAATIARSLAAKFLAAGRFTFAPVAPAWTTPLALDVALEHSFMEEGFFNLSVQAVGYEVGVEDPKVHVYVTKGPRKSEREIQDDAGDIPVEINRVGKVVVRPEATSASASIAGSHFVRNGRVACGSSCAPAGENYSGTLGALVRKNGAAALYALSNNHVLAACNHVPLDMPILSPSNADGRPGIASPAEVARLSDICELRSGAPSLVEPIREDIALAQVPRPEVVTSWQGDATVGYDTPIDVVAPTSRLRVKKVGRTSGLTTGAVEALIPDFLGIPYKCRFFSATVWLKSIWTIRADVGETFALPGDSGSLVVTEDGSAAVGVVFAASLPDGEVGYIIPMDYAVTLFGGLSLVAGHGV